MMRSKQGFTLLETLIVLFVFSIVSLIAINGMHTFLHIQNRLETKIKRLSELQYAMLLMAKDFQYSVGHSIQVKNNKILLGHVIYHLKKDNLFRMNLQTIKNKPILFISKVKKINCEYINQKNQLTKAIKLTLFLEDLGVLRAIYPL